MIRKKIVLFLASLLLFFSCSAKEKLPRDIKDWYNLHSVLMGAKVPQWIVEGNCSERYCFLRIPEKAQRMYMAVFWKVRAEGLSEVFYHNINMANLLFNGWSTDRGYVYSLCGMPQDIYYIRNQRDNTKNDIEGNQHQIWRYYLRGCTYSIVFEYRIGTWRLSLNSARGTNDYSLLIKKSLEIFHPTKEGWDLVGGWVLDWIEDFKETT